VSTTYTHCDPAHPGDVTSVTDPVGRTASFTYDADGEVCLDDDHAVRWRYGHDCCGVRRWMAKRCARLPAPHCGTRVVPCAWRFARRRHHDDGVRRSRRGPTSVTEPERAHRHQGLRHGRQRSKTRLTRSATPPRHVRRRQISLRPPRRPTAARCTRRTTQTETCARRPTATATRRRTRTIRLGIAISVTDPLNRATSYGYDPAGNVITRTILPARSRRQHTTRRTKLTAICYSDGATPNVAYAYNADGHRKSMQDGTGTTTYTYDGTNA